MRAERSNHRSSQWQIGAVYETVKNGLAIQKQNGNPQTVAAQVNAGVIMLQPERKR